MEKPKLIKDLGTMYPTDKSKHKGHYGEFECMICKEKTHFITQIKHVNSGHTISCGCHHKNQLIKRNTTHGLSGDPLFSVWVDMKKRCYSKKYKGYRYYGERGIKVCDDWLNTPKSFISWGYNNGFKKGLEIDRIDNDGDYSPSNCKFSNRFTNAQNQRLLRSNNTSGYRGVAKHRNKWKAEIQHNGIYCYIGIYSSPELAAQAYNNWVIEHGGNHPLNIIYN